MSPTSRGDRQGQVPLLRRIGWRVALLTGVVGFTVATAASLLLLGEETRAFASAVRGHLGLVAGLLEVAVPPPDRPGEGHPWQRFVAGGAADYPEALAALRVLNDEGVILASSRPAEVGSRLPPEARRIFNLGPLERPRAATSALGTRDLALPDRFGLLQPLQAQGGCASRCHGSDAPHRAWIDLEVHGGPLHASVLRFRHLAILAWIGLLLGLLGLVAGVVRLVLGRPLEELARTMALAEKGDLMVRAVEGRRDEIGLLADAFNKLLRRITDLRVDMLDTNLSHKSELSSKQQLEERGRALEEANQRLEARVNDISLLLEVSRVASSSLDLDRVLSAFSERLSRSLAIPRVAVALLSDDAERLTVASAHGYAEPERVIGLILPPGKGLCWAALQTREPVVAPSTPDAQGDLQGSVREEGPRAAVPIRHKGTTFGVLLLGRPEGPQFGEQDVRLLVSIAEQVALAVANARLHEEARTMAITDPLTGLYNRRFLGHQLEQEWSRARRFAQPLSVLMIDVDHFKDYNDANGHLFGDRALARIARLLRGALRQVDVVARYGGEEFVVLLPHTAEPGAVGVADKLRQLVAQGEFPGAEALRSGRLTISVGVASLPLDVPCTVEQVLAAADRALYRAKEQGRDRVYSEHILPVVPSTSLG